MKRLCTFLARRERYFSPQLGTLFVLVMNLCNYVLNFHHRAQLYVCINILNRDLKAKICWLTFFPATMISIGSFSSGIRPASIKGASSEELSVDGVFRQDVTSKWVWIPLENCFSHLQMPKSHQPQNHDKGLIDEGEEDVLLCGFSTFQA